MQWALQHQICFETFSFQNIKTHRVLSAKIDQSMYSVPGCVLLKPVVPKTIRSFCKCSFDSSFIPNAINAYSVNVSESFVMLNREKYFFLRKL